MVSVTKKILSKLLQAAKCTNIFNGIHCELSLKCEVGHRAFSHFVPIAHLK